MPYVVTRELCVTTLVAHILYYKRSFDTVTAHLSLTALFIPTFPVTGAGRCRVRPAGFLAPQYFFFCEFSLYKTRAEVRYTLRSSIGLC